MPIKKTKAATIKVVATTWRYGLVNRPPDIGAVPKDYESYDPSNEGIDAIRHGILTYRRELTDHEIKGYELLPLSGKDGKPIEHTKFPVAVQNKAREAIETLKYIAENCDRPYDRGVVRELENANKHIEIFKQYGKGKHYNAEKALEELDYDPKTSIVHSATDDDKAPAKEEPKENKPQESKESEKPEDKKETEPVEPTKPAKAEEPAKPSKPAEPTKPSKPSEPSKPTQVK